MKVIVKGNFPVNCVAELSDYFKITYQPLGFKVKFEEIELDFMVDRDFTFSFVPTIEDCYLGNGEDFLQNKSANIAKFSVSYTGNNSYYDSIVPIKNASDVFTIIVLILSRFYCDTDIEFARKLFDFCEKSININSRFYEKFDEEKFKAFDSAYLFFENYFKKWNHRS